MLEYKDEQLKYFSMMLRHRLKNPRNIGATIIDHTRLAITRQDDHLGRYLGSFLRRGSSLSFVIYARWNPFGNCGFVYLLTVNAVVSEFPRDLKIEATRFLGQNGGNSPEFGIINIQHSHNQSFDAAAYLEVIPTIICPGLRHEFKPRRDVQLKSTSSRGSTSSVDSPHTDRRYLDTALSLIRRSNIKVIECQGDIPQDIGDDWNIICKSSLGHCYYLVHNSANKDVIIYLPHEYQLNSSQRNSVAEFVHGFRGESSARLSVTRMADQSMSCVSSDTIAGLLLTMGVLPHVLFRVTFEDIICFQMNWDPLSGRLQHVEVMRTDSLSQRLQALSSSPSSTYSSMPSSQETEIYDPDVVRSQSSHGSYYKPELVFSCQDGVEDPILSQSQELIQAGIAEIRASIAGIASTVPPVRGMTIDDPIGDVLNHTLLFRRNLPVLLGAWEKYVKIKFAPLASLVEWEEGKVPLSLGDCDYEVCPIIDDKVNVIVILDINKQEWYYLNGDSNPNVAEEQYNALMDIIRKKYPRLSSKVNYQITTSNHFHKSYPKIHLLMMLHTIGQLFKYARVMPKKTVYTEKSFRLYCWSLCIEVQHLNYQHNLSKGLISSQGYLLPGALRSYSSPLQFERTVVATHICMICGARGFNNMGRHMSMAHGGQAKAANLARQQSWG